MKIFSGIQPTGELHIGNYLGAVKQWLQLQDEHECLFCIVDLHAITIPQDPEALRKATLGKAIEYLATGLNPEKCIMFVQSHVSQHPELAWIFNTITPLSELERMTQYKDKAAKQKKGVNAGLLTYPALMTADILLYKTDAVPVGEDQSQHLELARMTARKFNHTYGDVFVEPETILPNEGARIMSLKDPTRKMSKSDGPSSYISLFEEPSSVQKKIMSAQTDTGKVIKYDPKKKPGISNLLTIYALLSDKPIKEVEQRFKGKGYAQLKKALAELMINELEPFRKKREELLRRETYVHEILKKGAEKARATAESTMKEVRAQIGFLSF